jgi:nitroreductase
MEVKEVIGRRRTIRFFEPDREVERSKVQKMLEAARRASCVGNVNSTRAIVLWRDQATDDLLSMLNNPLAWAAQTASCFLLWFWDKQAYYQQGETIIDLNDQRRTGINRELANQQNLEFMMPFFRRYWRAMFQGPLPAIDLGQAVAQATLVAYDEGLGTCCMGNADMARVAKLMGLPDTAVPVLLQAVGYPAESWEAGGQTHKAPFEELFSEMEFGRPFAADAAVVAELERGRLIQRPAPIPGRDEELASLADRLGVVEWYGPPAQRPPGKERNS